MTSFRRVLAKRTFNAFITILLIMLVNFMLFRVMPGDPALLYVPRVPSSNSDAIYERYVDLMGLDQPLHIQLYKYFVTTFTGDWGTSFVLERPVMEVLGDAIIWTILLLGVSSIITFTVGIWLGKVAANKRGRSTDVAISGFGLFFYGMPIFWFGVVLMVVFCSLWPVLPSANYITSGTSPFPLTLDKVVDICVHMILPVTTLSVGSLAGIILIQRNSLVDVLTEEYIVTAYAKGLSEREVMKRHATPNARLPVVTTIAMDVAFILGGAFQIEVVFSYSGIGMATVDAIWNYDYPVLQFIFFIGGVGVVVANLIADVVLVWLDPRVTIS